MAHTKRSDWLISDDMIATFEDGPVPKRERRAEVANSVAHILHSVGEDVARDGLRKTPDRIARMYDEILVGSEALVGQSVGEIPCSPRSLPPVGANCRPQGLPPGLTER